MTSILTNPAAMAALQTLRMIDRNLEETQSRVSSGYRVESAADNAAYWSISTTMRSDNKALSSVQDALGLGAAKVDTAYAAIESAIETVNEIKKKLVAAYGVDADRPKIQEEISQLQKQLGSIAESASFSGENWLQGKISAGTSGSYSPVTKSIVASFVRDSSGNISVETVDYTLGSDTVLFDTGGGKFGILDSELRFVKDNEALVSHKETDASGEVVNVAEYVVDGKTTTEVSALAGYTASGTGLYTDGSGLGYLKVGADKWVAVTDTAPAPVSSAATAVEPAAKAGGTDWYYVTTGAPAASDRSLGISVSTLDITKLGEITSTMESLNGGSSYIDADALDQMVAFVDQQLEAMTSSASVLGSLQSRIDMQENFVSTLMDVIDKGIGRLVDADMNEESTRLKALQTQQQLGIQSLSIANSNAENILSLFK